MIRYDMMRKNMVECQLQTNGIIQPEILRAFETVPREIFLPEQLKGVAYVDEDLPLPGGGYLPEPLVTARMLAALSLPGPEVALCIGDHTGYVSAVLSQLVTTVVALESRPRQLDGARSAWLLLDICNVAVARGMARRGCPEHAPYNVIFVCGAAGHIPPDLLRQLSPGGRLAAVLRGNGTPTGKITIYERGGHGAGIEERQIHDAATFPIEDFRGESAFVF